MSDAKVKLIAHRGYAVSLPQNSLLSFREAGRRGYWAIETDVRRTRDGLLVCSHDDNLLRHYGADVLVSQSDYSFLRRLHRVDAAAFPEEETVLPDFEEYLSLCKVYGCVPFIETKTPDVRQVLETALRVFDESEIVLSSVQFDHIAAAREVSKNVFVHHIFADEEKCRRLADMGNAGLSYNYPDLSFLPDGLIDSTHALGVKVCLRAGDTVEKVKQMMSLGLDYVPTNRVLPEDMQA